MRVKTNTTIEEINHSISNLVAQWGVTPEDNEIIFNKIVGLQIKKIRFMRGKTLTRLGNSLSVGVGESNNHQIDEVNIHNATLISMKRALTNLDLKPDMAYIDGIYKPDIDISSKCFIQGDNIIPEISAASIVAKVLRDNIMIRLDKMFPVYGFSRHKGYGTKEHMHAIELFGPSVYHRFSFAPLKN